MTAAIATKIFGIAAEALLKSGITQSVSKNLPGIIAGSKEAGAVESLAGLFNTVLAEGETGAGGIAGAIHNAKQGIFGDLAKKVLNENITALHGKIDDNAWDFLNEICVAVNKGEISLNDLDDSEKKALQQLQGHLNDVSTTVSEKKEHSNADVPTKEDSSATVSETPEQKRIKELEQELTKVKSSTKEKPKSEKPEDQVFDNVCHILDGEMKLNGSILGWGLKALFKKYGDVDISNGGLKDLMDKYATQKVRDNLKGYLKAEGDDAKNAILSKLTDEEQSALGMASKFITAAKYVPSWAIEGFSYAAEILDWGDHFLRGVPVIGHILKMPFARKALVSASQLADRFRDNLHGIREASLKMAA